VKVCIGRRSESVLRLVTVKYSFRNTEINNFILFRFELRVYEY